MVVLQRLVRSKLRLYDYMSSAVPSNFSVSKALFLNLFMTLIAIEHSTSTKRLSDISKPVLFPLYHSVHILTVSGDHRKSRKRSRNQRVRSGFSFHRGREEAVHCDRLRRHIAECSFGRECIEALWQCAYLPSLNFPGEARGCSW